MHELVQHNRPFVHELGRLCQPKIREQALLRPRSIYSIKEVAGKTLGLGHKLGQRLICKLYCTIQRVDFTVYSISRMVNQPQKEVSGV